MTALCSIFSFVGPCVIEIVRRPVTIKYKSPFNSTILFSFVVNVTGNDPSLDLTSKYRTSDGSILFTDSMSYPSDTDFTFRPSFFSYSITICSAARDLSAIAVVEGGVLTAGSCFPSSAISVGDLTSTTNDGSFTCSKLS